MIESIIEIGVAWITATIICILIFHVALTFKILRIGLTALKIKLFGDTDD